MEGNSFVYMCNPIHSCFTLSVNMSRLISSLSGILDSSILMYPYCMYWFNAVGMCVLYTLFISSISVWDVLRYFNEKVFDTNALHFTESEFFVNVLAT